MGRPFDFSYSTKNTAWFRQNGLCAHCGESLIDVVEHAHHVIPNQIGMPGNPQHRFLRTTDNCVILCEGCHSSAHDDDWGHGAMALAEFYPYSHGRTAYTDHVMWRRLITREWRHYISR